LIHDGSTAAQLIATTHDCGLLDPELFRRDQIWFTEKAPETWATRLYSLWDYSPRKGEDIRSGYLKGRYGAIPFIGEFRFDDAEPE
jgi:AAA15 family ATPase/GTPase